jgi:drug/metabolite transporter (DMT)-like permease
LLLGAALGLERPTWKGVIGVGLSIVGVALVVLDGLMSGHASLVGDLLALVAAVCVGA